MNEISIGKSKFTVGFKGIKTDTDESVLNMAYAKRASNFAFENGVLTGGIGIDAAEGFYPAPSIVRHAYPQMPSGRYAKQIFIYKRTDKQGNHDDKLIAHLDNGGFYYTSIFSNDTWHVIEGLYMSGEICAVNYPFRGEDSLLLSSDNDPLYIVTGGTALVCTKAPKFTSLAVYNERIFGSVNGTQNQVWFSDDFDPVNWTVGADEAGYINFSDECGEVLKVVSFSNYLYIFREFGIFRLTAFGDQSEFVLKKVFTDTGRIVKDSIESCGDKILFYASDGLYSFDGYQATRILKPLPNVSRTSLMSCAYLDDYYYMACDIWETGLQNNAVVRFRLSDRSVSVLYGYCVKQLISVRVHNGSQVLCVMDGAYKTKIGMMSESGRVMDTVTSKSYTSPENTLATSALKTVRSVSVLSDGTIKLTVILDGKKHDYAVKGNGTLKTVHVEKSGRSLGFKITCNTAAARIAPLTVEIDTLKF